MPSASTTVIGQLSPTCSTITPQTPPTQDRRMSKVSFSSRQPSSALPVDLRPKLPQAPLLISRLGPGPADVLDVPSRGEERASGQPVYARPRGRQPIDHRRDSEAAVLERVSYQRLWSFGLRCGMAMSSSRRAHRFPSIFLMRARRTGRLWTLTALALLTINRSGGSRRRAVTKAVGATADGLVVVTSERAGAGRARRCREL